MNKRIAYKADNIYTGTSVLRHHAVVTEDGIIEAVIPSITLDPDVEVKDYGDAIIAPPFIDLQLYGAFGRLLAVYPDAFTVSEIYRYAKEGGAAYCMPTVATNTYEVIFPCIDAIRDYWKQGGKGVLGLHVEGPWISKIRRGAHNPDWIFSPSIEQAKELLEYGKDVIKIITLAPEEVSQEAIELIRSYNITISAGHSNATYQQATDSFNNGIEAVTHLFNAMSPLHHREPGLVGASMDHPVGRASVIPDGYHVDFAAVRIAKKIMGDRLFVITDAVTETTQGYYPHTFDGDKYVSNGNLSGSALQLNKAVKNLVEKVGIKLEEALRMCSLYPARVIKKSDEIALLKKDFPAQLVILDNDMNVIEVVD